MKKETYVKMTQPFRDDPKRARALHRANKILTVVICAISMPASVAAVAEGYAAI